MMPNLLPAKRFAPLVARFVVRYSAAMRRCLLLAPLLWSAAVAGSALAAPLASVAVRADAGANQYLADGVVQAVRQSVLAAQVPGVITALPWRVGDRVAKGQVLVQLDARAASLQAAAGQAQAEAARATLVQAESEVARQRQLFARQFISAAQLERAERQYQVARAEAKARSAQGAALQTQSGFFTLTAPYAGVITELPAQVGEMASPGRALLTLADPTQLRVQVTLPQAVASNLAANRSAQLQFPALPAGQASVAVTGGTLLPVADAASHTRQMRFDLPANPTAQWVPGMFVRASLPLASAPNAPNASSVQGNAHANVHSGSVPTSAAPARLWLPQQALLRRAELQAVYVLDAQGRPWLRQVRPGVLAGDQVEILSGVSAGERVALDPVAAQSQAASPASAH